MFKVGDRLRYKDRFFTTIYKVVGIDKNEYIMKYRIGDNTTPRALIDYQ